MISYKKFDFELRKVQREFTFKPYFYDFASKPNIRLMICPKNRFLGVLPNTKKFGIFEIFETELVQKSWIRTDGLLRIEYFYYNSEEILVLVGLAKKKINFYEFSFSGKNKQNKPKIETMEAEKMPIDPKVLNKIRYGADFGLEGAGGLTLCKDGKNRMLVLTKSDG